MVGVWEAVRQKRVGAGIRRLEGMSAKNGHGVEVCYDVHPRQKANVEATSR